MVRVALRAQRDGTWVPISGAMALSDWQVGQVTLQSALAYVSQFPSSVQEAILCVGGVGMDNLVLRSIRYCE